MTPAEHAATVTLELARGAVFMKNHGVSPNNAGYASLAALLAKAEAGASRIEALEHSLDQQIGVTDNREAERDAAVQAAQEARFALRTAEAAMLKDRQDVRAAEQAAEQAQETLRRAAKILRVDNYDRGSRITEALAILDAALTGEGT